MHFRIQARDLELRHAFTIARGSRTMNRNLFVTLEHEGIEGYGEASPNIRYGESPENCREALEKILANLPPHPELYVTTIEKAVDSVPGAYAAKAAVDMAIMDWFGKSVGLPLYRIWGLNPEDAPPTCMTLGMDSPEKMRDKAREAKDFPVLKIKLGGPEDRAMVEAVRAVTDQTLQVDANEGWHDREAALREIEWLADRGVVLVEQPLPAARLEDAAWLKERSPLPLIADEAFTLPRDLLHLCEAYHGVNIKLMKCGGTHSAREAMTLARSLGMKVMLGCMVESSLGIAAAAQLAPLVDSADLDGNLLIANDPFDGHPVNRGRIALRDLPGLGVLPAGGGG